MNVAATLDRDGGTRRSEHDAAAYGAILVSQPAQYAGDDAYRGTRGKQPAGSATTIAMFTDMSLPAMNLFHQ